MKKNYLFLAAATTLFAACVQTDVVTDIPEPQQQAISFETFANKQTRVSIDNISTLQNVGFQVWGYKYPTSEGDIVWENVLDANTQAITKEQNFFTVFDGVDVTYSNNDWGYTNTQYWDQTSKYNFYAVAPKDPEPNASYSIEKGLITISNVKSAISSASYDYLIDRDGSINIVGTQKDEVPFIFNHIMSKVSFKLKAGISENIVVTKLTMSGWNNNTGIFNQATDYDATEYQTEVEAYKEWTINLGSSGDVFLVGGENSGVQTSDDEITLNSNGTPVPVEDWYIMVPQKIAANTLTFTISYKIVRTTTSAGGTSTTIEEIFTDQVGILENAQIWGTDTHTEYTISVAPKKIEFDVDATNGLNGWTNSNTPDDLTIQ